MDVLLLRHNLHQQVLARGDQVYVVLDDSPGCRALPEETLARFARVYRVSSYDSLEELSAVAADLSTQGIRIDKIAAVAEFTQYAAGYMAQLLGLEHFSPLLALRTRDKRVMKAIARQAGLSVARSYSMPGMGRGVDLDVLEAAVGLPLVLKPAAGWGTISTSLVRDRAELEASLDHYVIDPDLRSNHLLAEEYIDGDEFHVDAVWRDREPWIFYVSKYFNPRLRMWLDGGLNGSILLDETDHADLYKELRLLHAKFNDAVGFARGTTHLEVFRERGTGRLLFSEIATRMGGANVGELVAAKCGVNEGDISVHELLDGELRELPFGPAAFKYVAGLMITPLRTGTITRVPEMAEMLAHPNVISASNRVHVGEKLAALHPSTWCTLLVIGADSEQAVAEAAEDIAATFRIEMS